MRCITRFTKHIAIKDDDCVYTDNNTFWGISASRIDLSPGKL